MQPSYKYYRSIVASCRLPCALVDWDLLSANAKLTRERAHGLPVRIASKSIRSATIIKKILTEFEGFKGVLAYSAREAAYLCEQGLDDVVIAYPSTQSSDVDEVVPYLQSGRSVCFMVDHEEHVKLLHGVGQRHKIKIPLAIDIDLSIDWPGLYFGVHRSPIRTIHNLHALTSIIRVHSGVKLSGIMGYEAQLSIADRDRSRPLFASFVRGLKKFAEQKIAIQRQACVQSLRKWGIALDFVNGGGTGTMEFTAHDKSVTELTAGSAFFGPSSFDHFDHFSLAPAALFALPITRLPKPGVVTCQSGGFVASGPVHESKLPQPFLPHGLTLLPHEGAGEVQTPLKLPRHCTLTLGDPVFFRHAKAGELAEHFNELHVIKGGDIIATVTTYRGDGHAFY